MCLQDVDSLYFLSDDCFSTLCWLSGIISKPTAWYKWRKDHWRVGRGRRDNTPYHWTTLLLHSLSLPWTLLDTPVGGLPLRVVGRTREEKAFRGMLKPDVLHYAWPDTETAKSLLTNIRQPISTLLTTPLLLLTWLTGCTPVFETYSILPLEYI